MKGPKSPMGLTASTHSSVHKITHISHIYEHTQEYPQQAHTAVYNGQLIAMTYASTHLVVHA